MASAKLTRDAEADDSTSDDEKITGLHNVSWLSWRCRDASERDSINVPSLYGFLEDFYHFL